MITINFYLDLRSYYLDSSTFFKVNSNEIRHPAYLAEFVDHVLERLLVQIEIQQIQRIHLHVVVMQIAVY